MSQTGFELTIPATGKYYYYYYYYYYFRRNILFFCGRRLISLCFELVTTHCKAALHTYGAGVAQSVQRLATGWTIGVRGLGIFLFSNTFRPALEPIQHLIQWVPGALTLGVKRPRREADHSPPSSAEVKNV